VERRVVIGLGSNVGDRADYLARATAAIAAMPGAQLMGCSAVMETPPAGGPPQGDYLNGACLVTTSLSGRALLEQTRAIEARLGRVRPDSVRFGPRTIDLDLLWIEGEVIAEADLMVPHPRLHERVFALGPLLELVPDARDPRTGAGYAEMLAALRCV
jgi:2-amino-4-hydroxy-6-hydroxymethyldihydropteridine diphosphokinase